MKRVVVALLALVAACGWNGAVQNPESRDYPCGPQGKVCGGSYPNASCCWRGEECPAGYCCYVGHDNAFGIRPAKWQWQSHGAQ